MTSRRLRIGTRGSQLARWQAEWVRTQLQELGIEAELVLITTSGDRHQQWSVEALGTTGVFTKEIQQALLSREIDLAVHSLKDLPTRSVPGLTIAAIPPRGPVEDMLITRGGRSLMELPPGATVGTGSRRRAAQLLFHRPDLKIVPLRGNLDTRLRRLQEGVFDAIVVAAAGLARLGRLGEATQNLTPDYLLPAPGQGALAIEALESAAEVLELLAPLNDPCTAAEVTAERTALAALSAGCLAPVATWARLVQGQLILTARVLSPDGAEKLEVTCSGELSHPKRLGEKVGKLLKAQGADRLVSMARTSAEKAASED
ncbi:hydroxymethylbilane synthase [Thermogutta sp.]|uniref:hydroxymethylbilane synthase n=1 Tax=Thermogutta sp. TaxID=1962930 RepID=UPI0032207E41